MHGYLRRPNSPAGAATMLSAFSLVRLIGPHGRLHASRDRTEPHRRSCPLSWVGNARSDGRRDGRRDGSRDGRRDGRREGTRNGGKNFGTWRVTSNRREPPAKQLGVPVAAVQPRRPTGRNGSPGDPPGKAGDSSSGSGTGGTRSKSYVAPLL